MRSHAGRHLVCNITLPCIGFGLDNLVWEQVRQLIRELFGTSSVQITVYLKASLGPKEDNCHSDFNDNALAQAQENDESLHQVRKRIRNKCVPTIVKLQGHSRLGWQMFNQLSTLTQKNVICRKFEQLDGNLPFLQWFVPRSMVPESLTTLPSSKATGRLGANKVIEKMRKRFY